MINLIDKYKPIFNHLKKRYDDAQKVYMKIAEYAEPIMKEIAEMIECLEHRNEEIEKVICCFPDPFSRAELKGAYKRKFGVRPIC